MNRTISRAFLDEAGNSRVIINGKLQPIRYTHQNVIGLDAQKANWDFCKKYIDMCEPENRMKYPKLLTKTQKFCPTVPKIESRETFFYFKNHSYI